MRTQQARGFEIGEMLLQVEPRRRSFRRTDVGRRLVEHGWIAWFEYRC